MMIYNELDHEEQMSVKSESKCRCFWQENVFENVSNSNIAIEIIRISIN